MGVGPGRAVFNNHQVNRRCRAIGIPGTHTAEEWDALLKFCDHRCLLCGKHESELSKALCRYHFEADGKISNNIAGVEPLCRSCSGCKKKKYLDCRPEFVKQAVVSGQLVLMAASLDEAENSKRIMEHVTKLVRSS